MDDLPNIKTAIDLLYEAEFQIRDKIESDPFRIFNVFDVLSVQYKEVIMCRMLKELLDPKGKHGKGNKFLKLFFQVIKESKGEIVPDEELDKSGNVQVSNEYAIDGNRRIDILTKVGTRYIPIEVKIEACDQQNQVRDYLNYCQTKQEQSGNKGKTVLLYLTLDGHEPSEKSTGCNDSIKSVESCSENCGQNGIQTSTPTDSNLLSELDNSTELKSSVHSKDLDKDIIPISFKEEICKFLELCLKEADNESLYSNIKQYLYAVESISGNVPTPIIDALSKKLKTKSDFRAMDALNESLMVSKTYFLQELFALIEKKLKDKFLSNLSNDEQNDKKQKSLPYKLLTPYNDDSVFEHRTSVNYYYSQEKVFPSIILLVGKVKSNGKEYSLGITFEIDWKSYVGIIATTKQSDGKFFNSNTCQNDTNLVEKLISELKSTKKFRSYRRSTWWIDWEYVSASNLFSEKKCTPDFKELNDEYYDLLDSEGKRQKFADKVVERFENYLDALNIVLRNCQKDEDDLPILEIQI